MCLKLFNVISNNLYHEYQVFILLGPTNDMLIAIMTHKNFIIFFNLSRFKIKCKDLRAFYYLILSEQTVTNVFPIYHNYLYGDYHALLCIQITCKNAVIQGLHSRKYDSMGQSQGSLIKIIIIQLCKKQLLVILVQGFLIILELYSIFS